MSPDTVNLAEYLRLQAKDWARDVEQLDDEIAAAEATIVRLRERRADKQLQLASFRAGADFLQNMGFRVWRENGVVNVAVDPLPEPVKP